MLGRIKLTDSGDFSCTVKNAAGEVSKRFSVSVDGTKPYKNIHFNSISVAPFIDTKMEKNFAVKEGDRVELICPTGGIPQPNISWLATLGFKNDDDSVNWQPAQIGSSVDILGCLI